MRGRDGMRGKEKKEEGREESRRRLTEELSNKDSPLQPPEVSQNSFDRSLQQRARTSRAKTPTRSCRSWAWVSRSLPGEWLSTREGRRFEGCSGRGWGSCRTEEGELKKASVDELGEIESFGRKERWRETEMMFEQTHHSFFNGPTLYGAKISTLTNVILSIRSFMYGLLPPIPAAGSVSLLKSTRCRRHMMELNSRRMAVRRASE